MTDPTLELPAVHDHLPAVAGYRLEALAGSGGMARVYRAVEEGLERPVAIKVLCAHGGEQSAQRFEREARVVAALQHPGIVAIYRVTRTRDGDPCIVMPWLSGSLAERDLPLPEAEARDLLCALLDALAHAHAAQIVHRDLKPDNVLFDTAGRPLLADFGVALRVGGDARLTGEGLAVGSARYMSPEQALGREVDARSDLYSVGVLAFEVLTGAPPFIARDAITAALAHVEAPVPRLPLALRHWQVWLDQAMSKSPDDRFADAVAMAAALPQPMPQTQDAAVSALVASGWLRWLPAAMVLIIALFALWWIFGTSTDSTTTAAPLPVPTTAVQADSPVAAATTAVAPADPLVDAAVEPPVATELVVPGPGVLYQRFQDGDGPWLVPLPAAAGAPARAVTQSEVTRGEYARFAAASGRSVASCGGHSWREPGFSQADDHPVVCVSFADARAYAEWLSKRTGKRYRLPRLAEWEQLARPVRGQVPACDQAQLSAEGCSRTATASAASHLAVEPGVFGLIGNVREWSDDCSWAVKKANPVMHGLRGVGRWIQRKPAVERETRTCTGRRVVGSGFADQRAWPALATVASSAAYPDLGFRLIRED